MDGWGGGINGWGYVMDGVGRRYVMDGWVGRRY